MKAVAVLLLATAVLGWQDEQKMFKKWSEIKAMESCWGKDNLKTYMVNVKKAVSKCHGTDAPELELPIYSSPFRFINTIMTSGQRHQENLMQAVQSMARNMAQNMMQSNSMQSNMMNQFQQQQHQPNYQQGSNDMNYNTNQQFQQQYQPDNFQQGRNDMNYNMMNGQNFQGQNNRENMQSNNMPYNQVMDTVSMMKFMREFMKDKYNQNNVNARNFRDNNNMDYSKEFFRSFSGKNMRYKRQVSEDTNTLPGFLELGDRLADKLKETKEMAIAKIGNFTCVMKELNVLNDQNQIDLRLMKQDLENYNMPSEWFKNHEIRNLEICHQMSEAVPQSVQDDFNYPGAPNLAKMKVFMECWDKAGMRSCMRQDMKVKIENNFGPLEQILEQTGLTEAELFPLMQGLLYSSEEMEYM